MTTLSQLYKQKDKNGTGTAVNKTYIVPVAELYVEPGFNVREIDQEHVGEFRDAFIAGEYIPPLAVQVTEQGIKIIDGHHRYYGALAATDAGHPILRIECKDFVGNDADRIAFMVTSSQGKPLTPIERGNAYQRLVNQGWEHTEIASKVKRSVSDVVMHIDLVACDEPLLNMVRSGEVAATTAVALSREHGPQAGSVASRQMDKAKASGKSKLTRNAALPQFSAAKARQFIQIVADQADIALPDEARTILDAYREFLKDAGWETEPGGI
ncbi:ParB/RepB/Spo0J family partition protein [Raoultella terrigena]|uniref:ParB/RepB/Spo0J family partition protein n=1 Tax=Raoultella terrigena TaxID=577 RepID=UPI00349F42F0